MRIVIASLLLLAVNAAGFLPGLEEHPVLRNYPAWAALVSLVIAVYILVQSFLAKTGGRQSAAEPSRDAGPADAATGWTERSREIDAHVVHFLGLLQEKGRLVDFIMDDISAYNNEQVGAAARVVHQGCAQLIREHFSPEAVHEAREGAAVTLEPGYNPGEIRAVGKLAGAPPFQGTLLHHGWKAARIDLPRLADKPHSDGPLIITPAEVEVRAS